MPLDVTDNCQWITGTDVELYKGRIRQVDAHYCSLFTAKFMEWGKANAVIKQMKDPTDPIDSVIKYAQEKSGFSDCQSLLKQQEALSKLVVYAENPLSVGDFFSYLADFLASWYSIHVRGNEEHTGEKWSQILKGIGGWQAQFKDNQAFWKQTNRIRVKRDDFRTGYPSLGMVKFYLPPDDVLGCIDRLLGYYEMADISGTTPGAVIAYRLLTDLCHEDYGIIAKDKITETAEVLNNFKSNLISDITTGRAFVSVAAMIAQMHHSVPEVMMALNLIPREARVPEQENQDQEQVIYSPFLNNRKFFSDNYKGLIQEWLKSRATSLGYSGEGNNVGRALLIFQDIFQMPDKPDDANEIGLIVEYTIPENHNPTPNEFGDLFYNQFVNLLNGTWRGPAIPLEQVSTFLGNELIFKGLKSMEVDSPVFRALKNQFPYYTDKTRPDNVEALWRNFGFATPSTLRAIQGVKVYDKMLPPPQDNFDLVTIPHGSAVPSTGQATSAAAPSGSPLAGIDTATLEKALAIIHLLEGR